MVKAVQLRLLAIPVTTMAAMESDERREAHRGLVAAPARFFSFPLLSIDLFVAIAQYLTLHHKLLSLAVISRSFPVLTPACFASNELFVSTRDQYADLQRLYSTAAPSHRPFLLSRVRSLVWKLGLQSFVALGPSPTDSSSPFPSLRQLLTEHVDDLAPLFHSSASFQSLEHLTVRVAENPPSKYGRWEWGHPQGKLHGLWESLHSLAHLPCLRSLTLRDTHMNTDTFAFLLCLPSLQHLDLDTVEVWQEATVRPLEEDAAPQKKRKTVESDCNSAPASPLLISPSITSLMLPRMQYTDDRYLSTLLTQLGRTQQQAAVEGQYNAERRVLSTLSAGRMEDEDLMTAVLSSPLSSSLIALRIVTFPKGERGNWKPLPQLSLPCLRHLHCPIDDDDGGSYRGIALVQALSTQLLSLHLKCEYNDQEALDALTAIASCTQLITLDLSMKSDDNFFPPPSPLVFPRLRRLRLRVPDAAIKHVLAGCPSLEVCEMYLDHRAYGYRPVSCTIMMVLAELPRLRRVVIEMTDGNFFTDHHSVNKVRAWLQERSEAAPPLFPHLISLRIGGRYGQAIGPNAAPHFWSTVTALVRASPLRYLDMDAIAWPIDELSLLAALPRLRSLQVRLRRPELLVPFCYRELADERAHNHWSWLLDEVRQWQDDIRLTEQGQQGQRDEDDADWLTTLRYPLHLPMRFIEERVFGDNGTMDGREAFFVHVQHEISIATAASTDVVSAQ